MLILKKFIEPVDTCSVMQYVDTCNAIKSSARVHITVFKELQHVLFCEYCVTSIITNLKHTNLFFLFDVDRRQQFPYLVTSTSLIKEINKF